MDITPLNYMMMFLPVITLRPLRCMRLSALAEVFGHEDRCHDASLPGNITSLNGKPTGSTPIII
jgi:hypothetical protein